MTEHDPQPTRAVYELLIKALQDNESPDEQFGLREALHDVYKVFSTNDPDLIQALSAWQEAELITVDEKLYLFVLFSVAREIGPYNLKEIRTALVAQDLGVEGALGIVGGLIMDIELKDFLMSMVTKILVSSHK